MPMPGHKPSPIQMDENYSNEISDFSLFLLIWSVGLAGAIILQCLSWAVFGWAVGGLLLWEIPTFGAAVLILYFTERETPGERAKRIESELACEAERMALMDWRMARTFADARGELEQWDKINPLPIDASSDIIRREVQQLRARMDRERSAAQRANCK